MSSIERGCPTASGISVSGNGTVSRSGQHRQLVGQRGRDPVVLRALRGHRADGDHAPSPDSMGTVRGGAAPRIGSSTTSTPSR